MRPTGVATCCADAVATMKAINTGVAGLASRTCRRTTCAHGRVSCARARSRVVGGRLAVGATRFTRAI